MTDLKEKLAKIGFKVVDELLLHRAPVEVTVEKSPVLQYSTVYVGVHPVVGLSDEDLEELEKLRKEGYFII